jgi:hypothetical protein
MTAYQASWHLYKKTRQTPAQKDEIKGKAVLAIDAHSLISTAAWGWLTTAAFTGMATWAELIALWVVRLKGDEKE